MTTAKLSTFENERAERDADPPARSDVHERRRERVHGRARRRHAAGDVRARLRRGAARSSADSARASQTGSGVSSGERQPERQRDQRRLEPTDRRPADGRAQVDLADLEQAQEQRGAGDERRLLPPPCERSEGASGGMDARRPVRGVYGPGRRAGNGQSVRPSRLRLVPRPGASSPER